MTWRQEEDEWSAQTRNGTYTVGKAYSVTGERVGWGLWFDQDNGETEYLGTFEGSLTARSAARAHRLGMTLKR